MKRKEVGAVMINNHRVRQLFITIAFTLLLTEPATATEGKVKAYTIGVIPAAPPGNHPYEVVTVRGTAQPGNRHRIPAEAL